MAIQFSFKIKPVIHFPYRSTLGIYKNNHLVKVLGNQEGTSYPGLLSELESKTGATNYPSKIFRKTTR
jgi:hypothetical protein